MRTIIIITLMSCLSNLSWAGPSRNPVAACQYRLESRLKPGTPITITTTDGTTRTGSFRFVDGTTSTLHIAPDTGYTALDEGMIPLSSLDAVSYHRNCQGSMTIAGFFVGAVLGGLSAAHSADDDSGSYFTWDQRDSIGDGMIGALIGGIIGGLLGNWIGSQMHVSVTIDCF